MIVCICFDVSDRLVRDRAREGRSLGAVLEETGAAKACGACRLEIARVHASMGASSGPPCHRAAAA